MLRMNPELIQEIKASYQQKMIGMKAHYGHRQVDRYPPRIYVYATIGVKWN